MILIIKNVFLTSSISYYFEFIAVLKVKIKDTSAHN